MQYEKDGYTYIIYLEQSESIMAMLTQFCKDHQIINGQISGLGAIKEIELGSYDLKNQEYITHKLDDTWELTSYQANIQLKDGEPFIHAHINISDHDLTVKGGHLFDAKVAVVGELILRNINSNGKRVFNSEIGLACMNLGG
ncbi:MAG: DNA-binding protein [Candidatus Marinimicrobia bacterium]|nr:DNA-binding protein [Candidatus Neomarinimicrobiota bacterium]